MGELSATVAVFAGLTWGTLLVTYMRLGEILTELRKIRAQGNRR